MPQIDDVLDPDDPEFNDIRGDLARLFIAHKTDLRLADWSDGDIVARTSDILASLIACGTIALQRGDAARLARHRWFGEACDRLFQDQPATPLDS